MVYQNLADLDLQFSKQYVLHPGSVGQGLNYQNLHTVANLGKIFCSEKKMNSINSVLRATYTPGCDL